MRLDGRTIVITGAGSGIGRATAIAASQKGARLILVGRRAEALKATQQALSNLAASVCVPADITDVEGRRRVVASCASMGGINILVNNAGLVPSGHFEAMDDAVVAQVMSTNVSAPLSLIRDLLPQMKARHGGIVVNVGSVFGDIGHPMFAAYCASKFALRGLSDALRRELALVGIAVLYVAPRATHTPAAAGFSDLATAFGMAMDPPEAVARQILSAIERKTPVSYPRGAERFFVLVQKLAPALVDRALILKARPFAAPPADSIKVGAKITR